MTLECYVDILNLSSVRYGSGPLTQLVFYEQVLRMDQAGEFSFEVAASDPQIGELQPLRVVRAYAWLDGSWVEIGSGIIEAIERRINSDGTVVLHVSGADMLREYAAYTSIVNFAYLAAEGTTPMTHSQAVNLLRTLPIFDGYTYPAWTWTADPAPPNNTVTFPMNGESCLYAARKIADISGSHFVVTGFRTAQFASSFAASGIRAITLEGDLTGDLANDECIITSLNVTHDTREHVSRVYARGNGNGSAEMRMMFTSRTAPAGYTLNVGAGYLQHDASQALFPTSRRVQFKDIRPLTNSTGDIEAADNALFDSALAWLRQHIGANISPLYSLAVAQCRQLLRPLQTIFVSYRNPNIALTIEQELKILESTLRVDANGLRTTNLKVRAVDYWPQTDGQVVAETVEQSQVYSSAAQLNINSFAVAYRGQVSDTVIATFSLRLGKEITQIQSVIFDFRVVGLEDATDATLAGTTDAGGPTGTDSGGPTGTDSGGPTGTGSGGPTATGNDGGGGATSGGSHAHSFGVSGVPSPLGYPLYLYQIGDNWYLVAVGMSGSVGINVSTDSSHQHTIPAHQHSIAQHIHTIAPHAHGVTQHSHAMAQHSHAVPSLSMTHMPWRATSNILQATDTQYRINGGLWLGGYTDLGNGWYRIDLTAALVDAKKRPLQELNTIEFRGMVTRAGQIEAQATVRCSSQAIDALTLTMA